MMLEPPPFICTFAMSEKTRSFQMLDGRLALPCYIWSKMAAAPLSFKALFGQARSQLLATDAVM
jgi:hypothetical protein